MKYFDSLVSRCYICALLLSLWYVRSVLPGLYEFVSSPILQLSSHKAHMHLFLIK